MFLKQGMMRRVLYSLVPVLLFSLYLYGLRVLAVLAVSLVLGTAAEFLMERRRSRKVSEAVLVTAVLFALCLPPKVPLWVVAVGILFSVVFGKGVYGGFGRNIFNPAITGRMFVYISFPTVLDASWMSPGMFGTLAEAVSGPTPLEALHAGTAAPDIGDLLIGFRGGSIGEGSIILIAAAAVYLAATKTANWRIMLSTYGAASLIALGTDLFGMGLPFLPSILSGSLAFVAVFMATDPVTAPKKPAAQWLYGLIIGSCAMLIRLFSAFPEGTSFGILIGNTFASLLDEAFTKKAAPTVQPASMPSEVNP